VSDRARSAAVRKPCMKLPKAAKGSLFCMQQPGARKSGVTRKGRLLGLPQLHGALAREIQELPHPRKKREHLGYSDVHP